MSVLDAIAVIQEIIIDESRARKAEMAIDADHKGEHDPMPIGVRESLEEFESNSDSTERDPEQYSRMLRMGV